MDYQEYKSMKMSFSRKRARLEMERDQLKFVYDQRSMRSHCLKNWDGRIQSHLSEIRRMEFLLFNSREEWTEHCEKQTVLNELDRQQQGDDDAYEDDHDGTKLLGPLGQDLDTADEGAHADRSRDNRDGSPILPDGQGGDMNAEEYIDLQDPHTTGAKQRHAEEEKRDAGELPSGREPPSSAGFYFDPPLGAGQDRPRGRASPKLPGRVEHTREPSVARGGDTRGENDTASSAQQSLIPYRPRSISQALARHHPVPEEDPGRSYDGRPRVMAENYPVREYQALPSGRPREVYREEPRMYAPRGGFVSHDEAPRYYAVDRVTAAQREYALPGSTHRSAHFVPGRTGFVHHQSSSSYSRHELHYQGYRDDERSRAPRPPPPGRVVSPAYTESTSSRPKSQREERYGSDDDPIHLETRAKKRRISLLE